VVLKFIPAQPDFIALLQKAGSRNGSSSGYDLIGRLITSPYACGTFIKHHLRTLHAWKTLLNYIK
jgi:hypothetical protein